MSASCVAVGARPLYWLYANYREEFVESRPLLSILLGGSCYFELEQDSGKPVMMGRRLVGLRRHIDLSL